MDMKKIAQKIKKNALIAIPALAFILSIAGLTDNLIGALGHNHIYQQAETYLQEAEKASTKTFIALSAAKAGLAILQSSRAGFSFIVEAEVQLGNAFTALSHLVDYAWEGSLIGLLVLTITQLALKFSYSILSLIFTLLSLCWLLYAVSIKFSNTFQHMAKRLFRSAITAAFMLVIAFPLTIYASSQISHSLTAETKSAVYAGLEQHNSLYSHNQEHSDNLKDNSKSVIKELETKRNDIKSHVKTMHTYVYQHIAILLLETLILPFALLAILYVTVRQFTKGRGADVSTY